MGQGGPVGGSRGDAAARIRIDLSDLRNAPNVAREAGRAVARELEASLRQRRVAVRTAAREQAALDRQRTAELRAALTQRRVAVRAAAREEVAAQRTAQREQAALDRQRTAELKAALQQRKVAVRAAAREQAQIQRQAAAQQRAFVGGAATFAGAAFAGPLGGIAGALAGGSSALPLAAGLAVAELGRAAIAGEQLATTYQRQQVAALQLAGSQSRLNALLEAYQRATGGAVDQATALSEVTRLQAIGFADSAQELERFVRISRGISLATGRPQEFVTQELALTLANVSERRLDQIGLSIAEVDERVTQLRASNSGLTREMAFQQAVLEVAEQKYADLTKTAAGQATGVERLRKEWRDLRLELAQDAKGPIDETSNAVADLIRKVREARQEFERLAQAADLRRQGVPTSLANLAVERFGSDAARHGRPGAAARRAGSADAGFRDDQIAAMQEWATAVQEIERSANRQRIDATRQYEQQRSSIIANYAKGRAREAEDFARQRANAERKHQLAILDVQQDAARQRAKWEEDLARRISEMQADSAEKRAEWEEERGERIADVRQDANERLQELEEDFARQRERAAAEHRDNLLSAAGRLDAIALQEEQRRFAREQQEAQKDHRKRVDDEREAEQERIDEINEAHAERLEDEQKALDKSIRQAREAHQRQLDEQVEATRLRLEEMQAAFEEQQQQEDVERGIRLARQAEDHNEQLIELERQHGERIAQIGRHAAEERQALDDAFKNEILPEVGLFWEGWKTLQKRRQDQALDLFDDWWDEINKRFDPKAQGEPGVPVGPSQPNLTTPQRLPAFQRGGFVPSTGPALLHAGEYVLNPNAARLLADAMGGLPGMPASGRTSNMNMGGVTINMAITGGPNASAPDIAREVRQALMGEFERLGYGA